MHRVDGERAAALRAADERFDRVARAASESRRAREASASALPTEPSGAVASEGAVRYLLPANLDTSRAPARPVAAEPRDEPEGADPGDERTRWLQ